MAAPGALGNLSGPVSLAVVVGRPASTAFALAADALLMAAAGAHVVDVRRRTRAGTRRWSPWRSAAFAIGLLLVYVAVGSGLARYDARPSVVVAQHVLLMMAAPPLLVLGGVEARAALRAPRGRRWGLAVWTAYYGSMAGFFLTPLFPQSLHDPLLLEGSELWFGVVGLVFSTLVVGGRPGAAHGAPYWLRIVAILGGAPAETAVGLTLLLWPHQLAPGVGLAATHTAGLVLWAGGMLTSGLSLAYVLGLWCLDDSRRSAGLDGVLDAALPVNVADGTGCGHPGRG